MTLTDPPKLQEQPEQTLPDVTATVAAARDAAAWWAGLGYAERRRRTLAWKHAIANGAEELAEIISRETGKPVGDATLEIMLTLGHLDWAAKHAKKVLKRRGVPAGAVAFNQKATLGYEPYGVVAVIGPWNYPLYTPMGSIGYAIAAGNAVVFKPSELTPETALWLAEAWKRANPEQPVLQVVTGGGEVGGALIRAGVDKVGFTGSTATAKRVMAACAEQLTPLVAECGGKDAMIVAADANLDLATDFAVFGGFGNSGQTCVGVERVYVVESVRDRFLDLLVQKARTLTPGADESASYGRMTHPAGGDVVREHVQDALTRGGTAVLGGVDSVKAPYVEPIVLTGVPEDADAVCVETFGPTLVVNGVADLDEAVERANATEYGLGASIFTRDHRAGERLAARLKAGAVTIDSVLGFAGVAALPFGGVGGSGFGRVHGPDGLREFSRAKSMTVQRFKAPLDLLRIDRSERDMKIAKSMLHSLHGSKHGA